MYLAKILLLSTTISMVTALPMVGGGGPTGNNSQEQQCREDLQGLNTSLSNASAAQAEIDAANNSASWAANTAAALMRDQATVTLAAAMREANAYAAEMNELGCAQQR